MWSGNTSNKKGPWKGPFPRFFPVLLGLFPKYLYFQAVPKYMSMVTHHTTVYPAFVAGIVFGGKSCYLCPEEPCFDLPVKFFINLASNPPMASGTYVFPRVILYYCIQLQFQLLFDV